MSIKQIEESAAVWLARRDSGNWNDADHAGFNEWLNASTAHRVAYLRLEAAWTEAGRLKALGAGLPSDQVPPPGAWGNHPFSKSETGTAPALSAPTNTLRRWAYAS